MAWRHKLKNIVFLGTPHHGAQMERVGNWIDTTLLSKRVTQPFAAIGYIRSSGITDLRYGHVLTSSWQGKDRFERLPDARAATLARWRQLLWHSCHHVKRVQRFERRADWLRSGAPAQRPGPAR